MNVTCYGGGVIGASWATNFVIGGCQVRLFSRRRESVEAAKNQICKNLTYLSNYDCIKAEEIPKILESIVFTTDPKTALEGANFVQESGPEKIDTKHEIVDIVESFVSPECIVASSTSGLRITDIAAKAKYPERFIGAHPFNPPHLIPLVEITCGEKTEKKYLEQALSFYRSMKKEPIVLKKEKIGFVANRLSHAVLREVMSLVAEGVCTPEEADKALVYGPGLRWASIGQTVIGELGSPGGNREAAIRFKALNEMIFRDLENRTTLPDNWGEISANGAAETIAHMPDSIGHTKEDVAQFRDKVLIELLKLHGKF